MRLFYHALLLMTFTLSFSSATLSEDIAGFDFGGEFAGRDDYAEITGDTLLPHEYRINDVKFFDVGEVGTSKDGIIRSLGFFKEYQISTTNLHVIKNEIKSDFERLLEGLEKRWGEFDKTNARYVLGLGGTTGLIYLNDVEEVADNLNPRSDEVGRVMLMLTGKAEPDFVMGEQQNVSLSLIYLDKKLAAEIQEKRESEVQGF